MTFIQKFIILHVVMNVMSVMSLSGFSSHFKLQRAIFSNCYIVLSVRVMK